MAQEAKYEKLYQTVMEYEKKLHEKNQRRIKRGIVYLFVIPLVFLVLLFWTESSKPVFLMLWIASLFLIAVYLIGVEYMDYKLQEKLNEFTDKEDAEVEQLIEIDIGDVEASLKNVKEKVEKTFHAEEEVEPDEEHI